MSAHTCKRFVKQEQIGLCGEHHRDFEFSTVTMTQRGGKVIRALGKATAIKRAPSAIVLDLDATDDPVHGEQEGRFFNAYYDCYCYLPLYVFCGRHLLAAKLRRASIDAAAGAVEEVARIVAQIRRRWPNVRILLRADSGFAREELMAWCEASAVDYVCGLARNPRLSEKIEAELAGAAAEHAATGARYGASRTLPTRPWTAGAANAASSPRPSICRRARTPVTS